jgi:perosamine synthetase
MEIPSTKPFFSEEDIQAITDEIRIILRSGRLILGPYTKQLEKSFGEYCGVKHAIAVSTCTSALKIAMNYFGVQGKDVIVPTNTFIATANAVIFSGGNPVLADIKKDTLCLDPIDLVNKITPMTKGVIVVHIAGFPCSDIDEIQAICRERGLFLLEDVAHAHGATINDKRVGSIGEAGCFSFYPTKVMTTCTGGMLTTNNDSLYEYALSMRHYGVGKGLHNIVNLGDDCLMDEISALLGIYQLQSLERNIIRRNQIANIYSEVLRDFAGINIFNVPAHIRHSYYKYPIFLSSDVDKSRLIKRMQDEHGISIGSVYDPPCHLQPIYQNLFGFRQGMFPVADEILKRTCCLPMFQQLSDKEIEYIMNSLKSVLPGCTMAPLI